LDGEVSNALPTPVKGTGKDSPDPIADTNVTDNQRNKGGLSDLNKSLSSNFFQNLRQVNNNENKANKPTVKSDNSVEVSQVYKPPSTERALNIKRRETAAAVAHMKDKLRSMGILAATISKPIQSSSNTQDSDKTETNSSNDRVEGFPPPPPDEAATRQSISMIRASNSSIHTLDMDTLSG
jgi:hypothetical protein